MMAERVAKDDLWLPDELQLAYDLLLEEASAASAAAENRKRAMEQERDDDELIASLTRRLAMSFPHKEKVMASSPQSTLFGPGRSSSFSSDNCSPDGPSKVSSPLSTPFEQQQRGPDDDLDLLCAAAGRVVRLGLEEDRAPRKPDPHHFKPNPVLIQQQLQAAQFYQMRREQLLKQQLAAAWRSAAAGRRMDLSQSAWPALQKPRQQQQQTVPGSGMRAVFINGSGARRGSAGTGVFLPRHAGSRIEPKKKPSTCSTTVLLPARVVQALNLELDEAGVPSRRTGAYFDHGKRNVCGNEQHYSAAAAAVAEQWWFL
ncbi:uncharacterized protein M6B38_322120 [Iris pallida]|uniref:Uncharacterized protein n=1 Tax=Iris pallida TaxID=29817 RepID=A0AAX6HBN1_IRIPA|nr:uncharacterized protein M6B38_322120 [Iris pallida]